MRRKLTSMSCDFCGWLRWRTRTSPPTKSCSRTCNPDSRAGAPAKAIFSRLSSASRPPRQRGKNFVGDWTTPARSIAGSLVLKRSIFAFPLRFEAFRDQRMMPWLSRCGRTPRCWQRSPTSRQPGRHSVSPTEPSFQTCCWRGARRAVMTPIHSSADAMMFRARSSCRGIFFAAGRMHGGVPRWPSVTRKKRCGMTRLQRDALEAIDKAWAARTITADRIAALKRQLVAERKTIAIYRQEYEIGRRSLIDLLNAENQYFGSAVSLTSARGVIVFADYQLLAAMGFLLDYLRT